MREGEVRNLFLVRVGQRVQRHPQRVFPASTAAWNAAS